MNTSTSKRRGASMLAITGVVVLGAVMIVGSVLPPWPLISIEYFGQQSPIANFVQVVFDYPIPHYSAFLFVVEEPAHVSALELAPVILQAVIVAVLTFTLVRLLAGLAGGESFSPVVGRSLTTFSVVALAGGLVQYLVGLWAWNVGMGWLDEGSTDPARELLLAQPPFPHWPVALVMVGLLAAALRVAFRDGAMLKREVDGLV